MRPRTKSEPEPARAGKRAGPTRGVVGNAFGVEIHSSVAIPELPAAPGLDGNPRVTLELVDDSAVKRAWPARDAERVLERIRPNGRPMMVVERHEELGFHIWAPYYGRHLVSSDGTDIRSALPAVSPWRWERLLFAQVLPLAAALSGRELFHASAVALDGGAVAFVGLSGAGKSSIAAHLVAQGAGLVADDVLALERTPSGVSSHPGSGLAGVAPHELASMSSAERARLGRRVGSADKTYLAVPIVAGALPLRALYFITRTDLEDVEIAPSESVPTRLLGSSFIAYLRSPEHLVEHLDVCTHIAATVPILELSVPPTAMARDVAAVVEEHARELAGARR